MKNTVKNGVKDTVKNRVKNAVKNRGTHRPLGAHLTGARHRDTLPLNNSGEQPCPQRSPISISSKEPSTS